MTSRNAFDTPTQTDAVDGEVVLRGPDGVALSMTPEAAEETGRRLLEAASSARRQRDGAGPADRGQNRGPRPD